MKAQMTLAPSSKYSPLINLLFKRLCAVSPGEEIAYGELSTVIGMDVQDKRVGYAIMRYARDLAEKDGQAVFETLRGEGLRRSTADETVKEVATGGLKKVRNSNRRQARKLEVVRQQIQDLSLEGRLNFAVGSQATAEVEQSVNARRLKEMKRQIVAATPELRRQLPQKF